MLGGHGGRKADVSTLLIALAHVTYIFPESTDKTITFTAGGSNHEWSDWVRIREDGNGTYFDSKFIQNTHVSSGMIEECNQVDKIYMIELAYGASKTIITPPRFTSGDKQYLPPLEQMRFRAAYILAGQQLFYRMMCATGGGTCKVSFRYHFHV